MRVQFREVSLKYGCNFAQPARSESTELLRLSEESREPESPTVKEADAPALRRPALRLPRLKGRKAPALEVEAGVPCGALPLPLLGRHLGACPRSGLAAEDAACEHDHPVPSLLDLFGRGSQHAQQASVAHHLPDRKQSHSDYYFRTMRLPGPHQSGALNQNSQEEVENWRSSEAKEARHLPQPQLGARRV